MAEDVKPDSSTGAEANATPDSAGQSDEGKGQGRNLGNVYGEFNRKYSDLAEKFESLSEGIAQITEKLSSLNPVQPQQPPYGYAPQPTAAPGPVSPFGAPRPLQIGRAHV